MQPLILITRPEPAALEFADLIRMRLGCGFRLVLSPILRLEMRDVLPDLVGVGALIFTSRNGVDAFAAATTRRDLICFCVGDATAQCARDHNMSARSAKGDAEALIALLQAAALPGPLLHIRGKHSRGDVAQRLLATGVEVQEVILYAQSAVPLSTEAQDMLGRESPVILPLFSPRSARLFFAEADATAPLRVVAMSANVASEVPLRAIDDLKIASRPDVQAMLDAIGALL